MFNNSWRSVRQNISQLNFVAGTEVVIAGFLREHRNCGQLNFLKIADHTGSLQVVFKNVSLGNIKKESVLAVKGTLAPKKAANLDDKFANWELQGIEWLVLSEAFEDSPFPLNSLGEPASESLRMQYRYLELRKDTIRCNLMLRHQVKQVIYNYFVDHNFIEVNTPTLSVPTREGAKTFNTSLMVNDVLHEFALSQSPQLYKQLLMIGGFERYFQFNTSFRLEDLRADRQYEFTQLDIELSYQTPAFLFDHIEKMMHLINEEVFNNTKDVSFIKMTYKEAMTKYGCDKRDIRFGNTIESLANKDNLDIYGIRFQADTDLKLNLIKDNFYLLSSAQEISNFSKELKLELDISIKQDEQILLVVTNPKDKEQDLLILSDLRKEAAKQLNLIDPDKWSFVWIIEWPLFIFNPISNEYQIAHHLFTRPAHDNKEIDVEHDQSCGYDLVLNGLEIASGSERIYTKQLQLKMFEAAGIGPEEIEDNFGWFLKAFDYGVPPHLGLAIGFERFLQLILNTESIRDVIAFPKNNHGFCKLANCPKKVTST